MMDSSSAWTGQDPNLSSAQQDDFHQYLNIGMTGISDGLGFDFPYDAGQHNAPMMQQNSGEGMDTRMDHAMDVQDAMMQGTMTAMSTATTHSGITGPVLGVGHPSSDIVELDAQIQYLQQQRQQRQMQEQQQRNYYAAQSRIIPPTPNSIEMHSANSHFYPPSDAPQALYDPYMRVKDTDLTFTPLVSPAVTPLEAHFNSLEFTTPGAYLSPLSSPALHAQNDHYNIYDARTSAAASPNDIAFDLSGLSSNHLNLARKATKKAASKPRTPRGVRQSPIVKPQKRRGTGSLSGQQLADIAEPAAEAQTTQSSTKSMSSTETSENGSISPEHLSDMAPPPLPASARNSIGKSPFLTSQNGQSRVKQLAGSSLSPATPASLMRIPKASKTDATASPAMSNRGDSEDLAMEDFSLPEPANPSTERPQLASLETQSDGQSTPAVESSNSSTPLPSPALVRPQSSISSASPVLNAMSGSSGIRKTPLLAPRGAKKRGSVSSVQASPALLPKISPSLKPLVRGVSTITEDTASLLLASKSNYQNILEGTHLPGVSYPAELSTNLTSKRTSHKIAEQGRRNRINSALQEIATLLPKGINKESSGTEKAESGGGEAGEDKKNAQSANSKASTVEMAIEYIKQLKQEVAEANKRAEEAEKALQSKKVEESSPAPVES